MILLEYTIVFGMGFVVGFAGHLLYAGWIEVDEQKTEGTEDKE